MPRSAFYSAVVLVVSIMFPQIAGAEAIEIAKIKHDGPVDFGTQILPILRKKCLACHNETDAESDLILESPAAMLKGGSEGPSIVPGKAAESYLIKLAAHQDEPVMPPEDNDVDAANLTPEELGLLSVWINEGAKAGSNQQDKIVWQPLPPGVNPVLAVASSKDGSIVAAGRANQVFVHHVSGLEFGRLTDPDLLKSGIYQQAGVAHLDMVHAIAMSPDNRWLATGGFRTAKIWQQDSALLKKWTPKADKPVTVILTDAAKPLGYLGCEDGAIEQFNSAIGESVRKENLHESKVISIAQLNETTFVSGSESGQIVIWNAVMEKLAEQTTSGLTALVATGTNQFATTQSDTKIHLWTFDVGKKTLTENGQIDIQTKSNQRLASAAGKQQLAVAENDKISLFDVSNKKLIRQWAHGAKISKIAFAADGSRLSTASEIGDIRIWNPADGKQVAELKAAPETGFSVAHAKFDLDVANRQVNNSKKDLEGAKKRQKQEEDNLKKSEENRKKAEEDKKKKEEAAKKATTESQQAEKSFQDLEGRIKAAEKTIGDGPAIIANSATKFEQTLTQLAKPQAEFEATVAAQVEAASKRDDAKQKLEADKENAELRKTLEEAEKQLQELTAKSKAAQKARDDVFIVASTANALRASTIKAVADSKVQLEKDKKSVDSTKKAAADKKKAADKAVNNQKAAVRTLESAVNSIEQAKKAIERAKTTVDEKQKGLSAVQAIAKQMDESFKAADKARNDFRFSVRELTFSPDGKILASANDDSSLCIWSAQNGAPIRQLADAPASPALDLTFTHDNRLLAAGSDRALRTWNPGYSWSLHRTIGAPDGESPLSDRVTALAFSPDSKLLAVGGGQPSRNGELRLYSVEDGSAKADFPETHSDTVFGIAFSPDGKLLATSAADRFMKITDIISGQVIKTFEGHTHHVLSVSWQADGRVLATGGADKVVKLWNFAEGSQLRTITGFGKEVTSLRHFGPNDSFVAVSGDKSIYNCNSGGQRNGIGKGGDFLYCVSTSRVGNTIVFGGHDSIVRVIDEKGKVLASFEPPK